MKNIILASLIALTATSAFAADNWTHYTQDGPIPTERHKNGATYQSNYIIQQYYYSHKVAFDPVDNKFKCQYNYGTALSDDYGWWDSLDRGKSLECASSVIHSAFGVDRGDPAMDNVRLKHWRAYSAPGQAYEKLKHLGKEGWNTFVNMASKGIYK